MQRNGILSKCSLLCKLVWNQKNEEAVYLFGIRDEETMDLFGEKIVKDEKQPMYENDV